MDLERVTFPAPVAAFLRANPGYTKKHAHLGLPPEEAYFRFRVLKDFRQIAPHLPKRVRSCLDIGSGIGGIDLLLYRARGSRLTVVDKRRRQERSRVYDVLSCARRFLIANGVRSSDIVTLSSQAGGLQGRLGRGVFDLILSLRALGYMFAYQTHRATLKEVLSPGGVMILDLRLMGRSALDPVIHERFRKADFPTHRQVIGQLRRDFGRARIIGRSRDYVRVLVARSQTLPARGW